MTLHRFLAVAISIVSIASSFAQEEAPAPTLADLKKQFVEDLRAEISPAALQYATELQKLERQYALAGDFEAAIAARDERSAIVKFLGEVGESGTSTAAKPEVSESNNPDDPGGSETSESDPLSFAATAAAVSGGAEFTDEGLEIETSGGAASWDLADFKPGGFEVVVGYSSKADAQVQAKESFFRLNGELPNSEGKIVTKSLGTLKITERSDTISLVLTADAEGSNLIIHSIRLISAKG